jgi:chromosome segregation ATPase
MMQSLPARVERLEASVERLHSDYREIRDTLRGMSDQLGDLVRLSERQASQRDGLDRVHSDVQAVCARVTSIDARVAAVEAQSRVVGAAGSSLLGVVARVIATGIVAAIAALVAVYARGVS